MKPKIYNQSPANAVGNLFDNFFNSNLNTLMGSDFFAHAPSINVKEDEKSYMLEMAAPGLKKEDLSINLDGDYLSISSEVKQENEQKEGTKFLRKEFNYSSFKRQMKLPENIKVDAISAKYENGVLLVEIPKVEEESTQLVKKIDIR